MNGTLKSYKWITCAAVAAFILSSNIAHAVSCNPKAQVHQQRLAAIQSAVSSGRIPSADDEQFVLCMLPEKEDQQAFKQQAQQNRIQEQARQQQQAEQRRQEAAYRAQAEAQRRAAAARELRAKEDEERRIAAIREPRLIIAPVGQWSDGFRFAEYSCWSATGEGTTGLLDSVNLQIERVWWDGKVQWLDYKQSISDEHVTGARFQSKTGKPESVIVMAGAGLGDRQKCLGGDDLLAAYKKRAATTEAFLPKLVQDGKIPHIETRFISRTVSKFRRGAVSFDSSAHEAGENASIFAVRDGWCQTNFEGNAWVICKDLAAPAGGWSNGFGTVFGGD